VIVYSRCGFSIILQRRLQALQAMIIVELDGMTFLSASPFSELLV
jgi:hypothetical protein